MNSGTSRPSTCSLRSRRTDQPSAWTSRMIDIGFLCWVVQAIHQMEDTRDGSAVRQHALHSGTHTTISATTTPSIHTRSRTGAGDLPIGSVRTSSSHYTDDPGETTTILA